MQQTIERRIRLLRVSTTRVDGGCLFGAIAKERWESFIGPDRQNRVAFGNYSMLVPLAEGWALVNAGPGDKAIPTKDIMPLRSRSSLLRDLKELGIPTREIKLVILTHLHTEHAGGGTYLTDAGRTLPTFSQAKYIVQKAAWDEACRPNERNAHQYYGGDFMPVRETGQLQLIEGRAEVAPGLFVEPMPGPTAGHQIVVAREAERAFAFVGALFPTQMHLVPKIVSSADRRPEQSASSKQTIMRQALIDHWQVAPVGADGWVASQELLAMADSAQSLMRMPIAQDSVPAHETSGMHSHVLSAATI